MRAQLIDRCANPDLQEQVDIAIEKMEKYCSIRILAYSLMGSIPLGMGNASSDYDLLALYEPQGIITPEQYGVINNKNQLSGVAHVAGQVNLLLVDVELCSLPFANMPEDVFFESYPHHLNTLTVHDPKFNVGVIAGHNSPKVASIFSDMFYYGEGVVTDRFGIIRSRFPKMKRLLRVYDFCNRRFVTTHGRLHHYLIEKGNVRLRTYLQSINDILAIEYALDHRDLPPPNVSFMLSHLDDSEVLGIARRYIEINSDTTCEKEKLLIDPNEVLNRWISGRLRHSSERLLELYSQSREVLFDIALD
ncbi:MAG: hypothetical protein ACRBBM_06155 [Pseudomonadaceae bacterium]